MCRTLLRLLAIVLCIVLAKRFCYRQTDGFALYKVLSTLSFQPNWEVTPPEQEEKVLELLDQPFYYLAKGAQSYVFVSQDGQAVIKLFRIYHLTPPAWMQFLNFPLCLQPLKLKKILAKREELGTDFESYVLAYNEMREETGLLFLHLNKTNHLKKTLTIYDRLNIAHQIDLDQVEFLVQKRADLVYPCIDTIAKREGLESAKGAISSLVQLLELRCQRGIFDKDPDLNTNFGFIGKQAVQIDIGRFRHDDRKISANAHRDEILRITDNFRQWLDQNHPSLSSHLLNEIQTLCAHDATL